MSELIIAGNWKMYKNKAEAKVFLQEFLPKVKQSKHNIILAPSFTLLDEVNKKLRGSNVKLASQNTFFAREGNFTGEVSVEMLKDFNKLKYVIVGHSERRNYFLEPDDFVNKKVLKALEYKIKPILCIGETHEQREKGLTKEILQKQITKGLKDVLYKEIKNIIIAYEPVWAIGSGQAMNAKEANTMAKFIKDFVDELYEYKINIKVLYGGSVNPKNANEFFVKDFIDGALIGGASLDVQKFSQIILEN